MDLLSGVGLFGFRLNCLDFFWRLWLGFVVLNRRIDFVFLGLCF